MSALMFETSSEKCKKAEKNHISSILLLAVAVVVCVFALLWRLGKDAGDGTLSEQHQTKLDLRIIFFAGSAGVDDGGFMQECYSGVANFLADRPESSSYIYEQLDIANSVAAVEAQIDDYDVFITPGYQFAGIYNLAASYPDKKFILIDAYPINSEERETEAKNIYAMKFAEEESGFLAGVAAAMQTKSGKVAVVNGIAFPNNVNFQFGFESGVSYAVRRLGATAQVVELPHYAGIDITGEVVGGNYVGHFNNLLVGKTIGAELLAEGVDIIFPAAGNSGKGVFDAVKERAGAFVIGVDADQYDLGRNGASNIVLTSVVKRAGETVRKQLCAIADGKFSGGNHLLRTDTDSTGYVSEPGRHQLTQDALSALESAYSLLKSGAVVPASNFNGHTPDDFPGLD
jgi:basic membrane protein A